MFSKHGSKDINFVPKLVKSAKPKVLSIVDTLAICKVLAGTVPDFG
jgi:hypothetical protein